MSVPIWARSAAALLTCLGCGGRSEAPAGADVVAPTEAELHGIWRRDYVTAGTVSQHSRLFFEPGGRLVVDSRATTTNLSEPSVTHFEGRFDVTPDGTVEYAWGDLGRVEASNDLTLVENADVLASHPCCRLLNGSDRYWTHRGYLAENRARTRFRREASRRAVAEDGTVTSFTRTRVELAFSAPPVTLGGRSDCRFEVAIRVETTGFEARDFGPLALPCLVEDDDQGLSTLVVPGWDQRDGRSLRETPYQARGLWAEMLEAESDVADWPEEPRAVLTAAFEPYLAFEKTRPDVLFHYLDANAPTIAGYAWTDE